MLAVFCLWWVPFQKIPSLFRSILVLMFSVSDLPQNCWVSPADDMIALHKHPDLVVSLGRMWGWRVWAVTDAEGAHVQSRGKCRLQGNISAKHFPADQHVSMQSCMSEQQRRDTAPSLLFCLHHPSDSYRLKWRVSFFSESSLQTSAVT